MTVTISAEVTRVFEQLQADPAFQKAMAFLEADNDAKIEENKQMAVIHGAPFKEAVLRSPMYRDKLEHYGAADCSIDEIGNVFGYVHGTAGARPKILLEGHLDTVFPEETPLTVTEKDGRLCCPGIGDDTAGLAANLSVLRAIRHAGLRPVGTLVFGGSVGEEGEGNARGIRAIMRNHGDIDAVLCMESDDADRVGLDATGIKRYEVVFKGPGGHSWAAYGLPSPIHAMGRAIAKIADMTPPVSPKTTFTVGLVSGGTSINSIPYEARMKVDMRSVDMAELDRLDSTVLSLVDTAVAEENLRWKNTQRITVEFRGIGDKPAGAMPRDAILTQVTAAATEAVGVTPRITPPASTNQNIPVNMGVPAVVIGAGGVFKNEHSLDEYYIPVNTHKGAQKALLMLFALAGLDGVTRPLAEPCLHRGPVR